MLRQDALSSNEPCAQVRSTAATQAPVLLSPDELLLSGNLDCDFVLLVVLL